MSLIIHCKMNDDAANTTVLDSSGNGNDGTAQQNTNVLSAVGKVNDALTFNGSGDKIIFASSLIPANDFTFTCWVKPTSLSSTKYVLGQYQNFMSYLTNAGLWRVSIGGNVNSGRTISTGVWSFLGITYDADTNLTIYTNEESDYDANVGVNVTQVQDTALGAYRATSAGNYHGLMDDVRLYDETLTPGQVARIRNAGHGTENTLAELYAENDGPLRSVLRH